MPKSSSRQAAPAPPLRGARDVTPRAITGKERPTPILMRALPGLRRAAGAHGLRADAAQRRREDCAIFLTFSGAMTPAGLHQSCLIPLIERGLVDCITTTGANLYHDAHRIIGHRIREIDPNAGDLQYRLARIIRIYDLGFWEETLLETDRLFSALLREPEFQKKMTTPELHYLLGKHLARDREGARREGARRSSSTAYRYGVPDLRRRGAGRVDLPQHREAQAPARRASSSSRSTSTTTSSRWARCSTTASRR